MKKKFLSLLLLTMVIFVQFGANRTASAGYANSGELKPLYNNAAYASVNASISSSGTLRIDYLLQGISGVMTGATVETTLARKVAGLWIPYYINQPGNKWVDTVTGSYFQKTRNFDLAYTGTYRVKVTYTVSGSGGSQDEIPFTVTKTYSNSKTK